MDKDSRIVTFRHKHEEPYSVTDFDTLHEHEWAEDSIPRIEEDAWKKRYAFEAGIISKTIKENNVKTVLELGSGPGTLSQLIQNECPDLDYHLIDKPLAKKYFEEQGWKGTFFARDLSMDFDTSGLLDNYDLVITNDFLEHVLNPSIIVQKIHTLTRKDSIYFISSPNWRMGHTFVYRGLFDFDNFIYFMYAHNFDVDPLIIPSPMQTPPYPLLDSESMLKPGAENFERSWNYYLQFRHTNRHAHKEGLNTFETIAGAMKSDSIG